MSSFALGLNPLAGTTDTDSVVARVVNHDVVMLCWCDFFGFTSGQWRNMIHGSHFFVHFMEQRMMGGYGNWGLRLLWE